MKLQRLYSYVRQALDDYQMIEEGDKVAVGISGGKDSLTLLYGLAGLRRFYPAKFDLVAVTVDLGYDGFDLEPVKQLCRELNVEYHVVSTQISRLVTDGDCSKCARLRKGALTDKIKELGCNKIAYAHNQDDVVETMLLSLIYEGRFSTFWPVTEFEEQVEGKNLTVIRPLVYVPLADVVGFKNKYQLPVVTNPCPYDKVTERSYVRTLLSDINKHAPGVKQRMMTAVCDGTIREWEPIQRKQK